MATFRKTSPVPADIVTYRFSDNLVYVKPATDYEATLDVAQKEFPEGLAHVDRDRIIFTIPATVGGTRQKVRISSGAWPSTIVRMLRGEVIDISITDSKEEKEKEAPPPQYLEVPDTDYNSRLSRSSPSSRCNSRASSPSGRSEKSSRSWIGKILG
ncbi:hypothetical protein C8J56DRAFT_444248 [Mycena floridula]|nr:hypothetical protein C8J56DRAFT_444248 [Mycena floridula]